MKAIFGFRYFDMMGLLLFLFLLLVESTIGFSIPKATTTTTTSRTAAMNPKSSFGMSWKKRRTNGLIFSSTEGDIADSTESNENTTPITTSTTNNNDTSTSSTTAAVTASSSDIWQAQLQSDEVQIVRKEMIQKYIQMGRTLEYAEREVDLFLSDSERSKQFLDMRRYAKAQEEELGFETWFQYGGILVLGFSIQVAIKYFKAYKEIYPDGGGPIPFL